MNGQITRFRLGTNMMEATDLSDQSSASPERPKCVGTWSGIASYVTIA